VTNTLAYFGPSVSDEEKNKFCAIVVETSWSLRKKNGKKFQNSNLTISLIFSFFLEAEVRFKAGKAGKTGQLSTIDLLFKLIS
jgi:hypothetical protein